MRDDAISRVGRFWLTDSRGNLGTMQLFFFAQNGKWRMLKPTRLQANGSVPNTSMSRLLYRNFVKGEWSVVYSWANLYPLLSKPLCPFSLSLGTCSRCYGLGRTRRSDQALQTLLPCPPIHHANKTFGNSFYGVNRLQARHAEFSLQGLVFKSSGPNLHPSSRVGLLGSKVKSDTKGENFISVHT